MIKLKREKINKMLEPKGEEEDKYLSLSANSFVFLRVVNIYFNLSFLSNHLLFDICPPWHILPGVFGRNSHQRGLHSISPFLFMLPTASVRAPPWPSGSNVLPSLVQRLPEEPWAWGAKTQGVHEIKTIFIIILRWSLLAAFSSHILSRVHMFENPPQASIKRNIWA